MEKSILFIKSKLVEYKSDYEGFFVLDDDNKLYLGTSSGWKELTNEEEDLSNLITNEEFLPVSTAAFGAIQSGTLGTINGESIESGNDITIDMDLCILCPQGLPTENISTNKVYGR